MFYVLAAFVLLVMVAWMVLQPLLRGDQSVADAEVADDEAEAPGTVADDEGEVVDLEAMIAERRRRMAAAEKEVQP
jgi:hypothetical protein